ncbi:MAG: hypothetical protein OXC42_09160 [Gammaproteobacteria bacterium]|nr:hypothetical protein [Gammaproteobacteria bacterium]
MKKLLFVVAWTAAMVVYAEENEPSNQMESAGRYEWLAYIENLPPETLQSNKARVVSVMSHYCAARARLMSLDLTDRSTKGHLRGAEFEKIEQRLDRKADDFVRRCGWMLE